jgi:hypothetical protein
MIIKNSKGEVITLNGLEKARADFNQKMANAMGLEVNVTTLTTIVKAVTDQKFFEVRPSLYLPVVVGNGAYGTSLETFRSFDHSDDFESGIINDGKDSKLASADASVDSVNVKIKDWAKESSWNHFEVQRASKSGVWDAIEMKVRARKRNWDLGIQRVAFLGSKTNTAIRGLLTQAGVTVNTDLITKPISEMTGAELKSFCAKVLGVYRKNCSFTAMPNRFVMPETDFLGIAAPANENFHVKSTKQVLEETFRTMTGKEDFQILPLAYADKAVSGQAYQQYALYNSEPESIRMDIPVDFNATVANSINGFSWQNVAFGQFTGAMAYRPAELMYFRFTPAS